MLSFTKTSGQGMWNNFSIIQYYEKYFLLENVVFSAAMLLVNTQKLRLENAVRTKIIV